LPEAKALAARDRGESLLGRLDLELDQRANPARLRTGPDPRRQDQPQAAGGRRAVLLSHPLAELDQLRRHPGLERLDRLGQAALGELAALGQTHHHANHSPSPERNHEHRSNVDAVHRLRQAIVERPGDTPGGEQRFYLRDRHPLRL
jgi:hypothetical protein